MSHVNDLNIIGHHRIEPGIRPPLRFNPCCLLCCDTLVVNSFVLSIVYVNIINIFI